jgi:molybdopterin-guanine dinucleotide biosynthesis protein A
VIVRDLPAVSAIVLAGGRSSRFGRDKLVEPIDGVPLLAHALDAVARVATEIVVAGGDAPTTTGIAIPIRSVRDPQPDGGPLVGVLAGLEAAREPTALVVGGDMPRLEPAVLAMLIRALAAAEPDAVDACVLAHRDRIQPLPIVVRTGAATVAAQRGLGRGSRSLYAWLDGMRVHALPEQEWRALDPRADTLLDVDRESDLGRIRS